MAAHEDRSKDQELFEKLLHRVIDQDDNARVNAAGVFANNVISRGYHPTDLQIRINGASSFPLMQHLKDEINRQYREIDYLRRHVDRAVLDEAKKAGTVEWRWPQFEELIRSRITGDPPEFTELSKGWKTQLIGLLNVSARTLSHWEAGTEQIPETAFIELEAKPKITSVGVTARDKKATATAKVKDISPLRDTELDSLRALWHAPNQIPAMTTFVFTHIQRRLPKKTDKHNNVIRERFQEEVKQRNSSARYLHMSRGLAMLPKRVEKQAGREDKSDTMTGEQLRVHAENWFGPDRSHFYLSQLLGYVRPYILDIYENKRDVTNNIAQVVSTIAIMVNDLDLDDEACEAEMMARVAAIPKQHKQARQNELPLNDTKLSNGNMRWDAEKLAFLHEQYELLVSQMRQEGKKPSPMDSTIRNALAELCSARFNHSLSANSMTGKIRDLIASGQIRRNDLE